MSSKTLTAHLDQVEAEFITLAESLFAITAILDAFCVLREHVTCGKSFEMDTQRVCFRIIHKGVKRACILEVANEFTHHPNPKDVANHIMHELVDNGHFVVGEGFKIREIAVGFYYAKATEPDIT